MVNGATRRGLSAVAVLGAGVIWTTAALAFAPRALPWAPTPERVLMTAPDVVGAKHHPSLAQAGFRVHGFRLDGHFAFAYRAGGPEVQSNLSPAAAGEIAGEIAHRLAPELGLDADDLAVDGVYPLQGWTTVFVAQRHQGVSVPRGFLVFGFNGAALTSIRNETFDLSSLEVAPRATAADAVELVVARAQAWNPAARVGQAASLEVWTPSDDPKAARLAWAVRVSSAQPRAELSFHVDAETLEVLAVDDEVRHAEGEARIRFEVHPVNADSAIEPHTVVGLSIGSAATDGDGEVVAPGTHTVTYAGPWARIQDASGRGTEQLQVSLSGEHQVVDVRPGELTQADPFVHTNIIKAYAKQLTPTLGWIDQRLGVNVNINETCNAFWDGQTINFFRAGGRCNNTGQVSSIVYHEFGHGYHQFLTRNVVGSIGEGTGDFLAATVLDDPIVGRGFASNGSGIRRIDGNNRFPDDYTGGVHQDGLIWAGALWDLREALMAKHGAWAGRILVDRAFVRAVSRGPGLATAYPSVLEGDDDDGDITNGTPNSCEINAAFDAHGLIDSGQINHQRVPGLASARIEHEAPGRFTPDADGQVWLQAAVSNASSCSSVAVEDLRLFVSIEGGAWSPVTLDTTSGAARAALADLEAGARFAYRWQIEADGRSFDLGSEQAPLRGIVDPGLIDIMTEGFESGLGAWAHGPLQGDLHSDWEAAEPLGRSYDPFEAKEGRRVLGTDLGSGGGLGGTDGAAKAGRSTFVEAPPVSTEGMQDVHLELWQHFAIAGTLRVLVDGKEVHRYTARGDEWSAGWRYLAIPLGEAAADRDAMTVRLEVQADVNNALGGWSIDDLRISGTEIPPPPPPPPPPVQMPPETPEDPETPVEVPSLPEPEAPAEPTPFTRNALGGGGCTCAAPTSRHVESFVAVFALGLIGLVGRRRRP